MAQKRFTIPIKSTHIDVTAFLEQAGGMDVLLAVAAVFLDLLPQWREDVRKDIAMRRPIELGDQLHRMKGCCGLMTAYGLAHLLEQAEQQLRCAGLDAVEEIIERIFREVSMMETEVRALIDDQSDPQA